MSDTKNKILLIGIGNYGRQDDGLGWCFLDEIKNRSGSRFDYDYKYQLNIEDASQVAEYEKVIFIDAYAEELTDGFLVQKCEMQENYEFTTHALNPGVILSLSKKLYDAESVALVVKIKGEKWELSEGLSENAMINLNNAISYFMGIIDLIESTDLHLNSSVNKT